MSGTRKSTDKLVDAFVERVNGGVRKRLDGDEVPESLRVGAPDEYDRYEWRIVPSSRITWIAEMERRLPGRLPASFESLVKRYVFPAFEIGDVLLFANTGTASPLELSTAGFADVGLSRVLLREGFVQFGRYCDRYDPVCFDLKKRRGGGECPVVYLDHEAALIGGRAEVLGQISDSFAAIISL